MVGQRQQILEQAATRIATWQNDPIRFVLDNFDVEPDSWQADALAAFGNPEIRRISMQACAGPGKTALLAWMAWHFLVCRGEHGDHPKGAAVATTWDNLRDNLWPELAKWQSKSPMLSSLFTWTKSQIVANDHPQTWFFSARSWSKTASQEEQGRTLSGLHSGYVLVLCDESGDIPISVLKTAEQALGNCKWGKIIQAGNPISREGMLYEAATRLRERWHVISVTGDPDDPNRSSRVDIDWARQQISDYGRDNPWVMAYVLGQFPPTAINSLLSVEDVNRAIARGLRQEDYTWAQKRLGIDVARFGDDKTVIFARQGLNAKIQPVIMRNATTDQIASRVALAKERWRCELEFVDDTGGYGAGVIDCLRTAGHKPIGVNFSSKPDDQKYLNKRAEIWWRMAEWVKAGGSLPNSPELIADLTAPTYTFQSGKFKLEEKDQIKKRLGRSPDVADALALTFSQVDIPGQLSSLDRAIFRQAASVGSAQTESNLYD